MIRAIGTGRNDDSRLGQEKSMGPTDHARWLAPGGDLRVRLLALHAWIGLGGRDFLHDQLIGAGLAVVSRAHDAILARLVGAVNDAGVEVAAAVVVLGNHLALRID